jgi:cephalosporin hydroxylase
MTKLEQDFHTYCYDSYTWLHTYFNNVQYPEVVKCPNVTYHVDSSVSSNFISLMHGISAQINGHILVILDSCHDKDHVLKELDAFSSLVTKDSYIIVEDTNINGHPVLPTFGPGPWEAVHEWLPKHSEFEIDKSLKNLVLLLIRMDI